jgi:S1-C subfamily serine protease
VTARPSVARLVVISRAAVVVLLIGLWAMLWTWQDEAAARAVPRPVAPCGPLLPSEQATIDLFEKTRVSVVYITTQAEVVGRWTRNVVNIPRGTGSEFTWNNRGHIVTNYHVVADGSGAQVRLSDEHDGSPRWSASAHWQICAADGAPGWSHTDLSVTLQAGQQEVRLGASYSKS